MPEAHSPAGGDARNSVREQRLESVVWKSRRLRWPWSYLCAPGSFRWSGMDHRRRIEERSGIGEGSEASQSESRTRSSSLFFFFVRREARWKLSFVFREFKGKENGE